MKFFQKIDTQLEINQIVSLGLVEELDLALEKETI